MNDSNSIANSKNRLSNLVLLIFLLTSPYVFTQEFSKNSAKPFGVKGGLCLILGSKDLKLSLALAQNKSLFVQVLQPDSETATNWGFAIATSDNRENMSVRNSLFDANHYNSNLFNLIIVEDASALGNNKLVDLDRLLTPMGVLALKSSNDAFNHEAKSLNLVSVKIEGYAEVYRKLLKPIKWQLPLDMKWQAGPQSQIANGYIGICFGAGKMFYLERMEKDEGDLNNSSAILIARDAYNGRVLWAQELPGVFHKGLALVATSKGRLFVKTSENKVFCLDGEYGNKLFDLAVKVNGESWLKLLSDEYICVHGSVFSTESGKKIWAFPNYRYQPLPETVIGENIFFCDSKNIIAKKLDTGEDLWTLDTSGFPKPVQPKALSSEGKDLLVRMDGDSKLELFFSLVEAETGKTRWSYEVKVEPGKEKYFNARNIRVTTSGDKLLIYFRQNKPNSYDDEFVATQLDLNTGKVLFENKINSSSGDYHGCFPEIYLGDAIVYYDLWVDKKTLTTIPAEIPHPACFFGMKSNDGMIYNFPSRKSSTISAVGPADKIFDLKPSSGIVKNYSKQTSSEPSKVTDWPFFRSNSETGNFIDAKIGQNLTKKWEVKIGLGSSSYGEMSSLRTGLTQAVIAYGLVIVSDIDGQRIVALDVATGQEKWVFAVGSRVDYSPTLYKGLCLFAARDGFVYSLDVHTGKLVYTLQVAPAIRFMARQDKLESLWPIESDVYIVNDIAYVSGKDKFGLAFNPTSGDIIAVEGAGDIALGKKIIAGGRGLKLSYEMLLKGNSIPRTNEDNVHGFSQNKFGNKLDARVLAFDADFTVAYQFLPAGEGWANKGKLLLSGFANDLKKPQWFSDPIELVVSDILLTKEYVYCVGHYQRIKNEPEIWVLSRETGEKLSSISVDGFPAFLGMSASANCLFVATREGKLICYKEK